MNINLTTQQLKQVLDLLTPGFTWRVISMQDTVDSISGMGNTTDLVFSPGSTQMGQHSYAALLIDGVGTAGNSYPIYDAADASFGVFPTYHASEGGSGPSHYAVGGYFVAIRFQEIQGSSDVQPALIEVVPIPGSRNIAWDMSAIEQIVPFSSHEWLCDTPGIYGWTHYLTDARIYVPNHRYFVPGLNSLVCYKPKPGEDSTAMFGGAIPLSTLIRGIDESAGYPAPRAEVVFANQGSLLDTTSFPLEIGVDGDNVELDLASSGDSNIVVLKDRTTDVAYDGLRMSQTLEEAVNAGATVDPSLPIVVNTPANASITNRSFIELVKEGTFTGPFVDAIVEAN